MSDPITRQICVNAYKDLQKLVGGNASRLFNDCTDCVTSSKAQDWVMLFNALGSLYYWNDKASQEAEHQAEKWAEGAWLRHAESRVDWSDPETHR